LVELAHVTARRPATADSYGMETPKKKRQELLLKCNG